MNSTEFFRLQLYWFDAYLLRKKRNTKHFNRRNSLSVCWREIAFNEVLNVIERIRCREMTATRHFPSRETHTFRCCCCFRSNVFILLNSAAIFSFFALRTHEEEEKKKGIYEITLKTNRMANTPHENVATVSKRESISDKTKIQYYYYIWFFFLYFCMWTKIQKSDYLHHIEHNNQTRNPKKKKKIKSRRKIRFLEKCESRNRIRSKLLK